MSNQNLIDAALNRSSNRIRDGSMQVPQDVRDAWNGYFATQAAGLAGAGRLMLRARILISSQWALAGAPGSIVRRNSMATLRNLADFVLVQVIQSHINAGSSPESSTSQSF